MASISLTKHQDAFLQRTARRLSELAGRRVSKREAFSLILSVAIDDEAVYDPETSDPIDPIRKKVCQGEREARTASFDIESLFNSLRAIERPY